MRIPSGVILCASVVFMANSSMPQAQLPPGNYDEARVSPYTLPDPLLMANGQHITAGAMWTAERRPELLRLFATEMYGKTPGPPPPLRASVDFEARDALGGTAIRRQVTLRFNATPDGPAMHFSYICP
jgi:hypothetical protein